MLTIRAGSPPSFGDLVEVAVVRRSSTTRGADRTTKKILRSVGRPAVVAGGEFARRQPLRGRGRSRRSAGTATVQICDRPIAVDEARAGDAVGAIDGLGDDADVALVRRLFGLRRLVCGVSSSGLVDDEKAIVFPSGDQTGFAAPRGRSVMARGSPPPSGIR